MKRYIILALAGVLPLLFLFSSCQSEERVDLPESQEHKEWLPRPESFSENYTLDQMVILSRHNIRSPMVGKGSILSRMTDSNYQWFLWEGAPSLLTPKGTRLESNMGAFFREWLEEKDILDDYANPYAFRFYANAKQRCQYTARSFADALLPGKNANVEMNVQFDTMDPVFNPQITKLSPEFETQAQKEVQVILNDPEIKLSERFALIERVINITGSPAYPDTASFSQFPTSVSFKLNAEPSMSGGLKMACSFADALVLQYYEEPDEQKAAFGKTLTLYDWTNISLIKEWYGDVLFTAPSVAVNVAHPLLITILSEIQNEKRIFSFLCGHDSNIGSVLAALEAEPYELDGAIEQRTPIGAKVVFEKFSGKDGQEYADIWLVYASVTQLRDESALSYKNPPMAKKISLAGLKANPDGLYLLSDVEERLTKAIKAY
ncbi:MAG: histidine-type phosphatase [Bacteroidales bacterium]|nr:histidine-type phosphatase [Bacteroidales bacterium]